MGVAFAGLRDVSDEGRNHESGYSMTVGDELLVVRLHRLLDKREIFGMIDEVAKAGSPAKRLWLLGANVDLTAEEMAEIGAYARSKVTGRARVAYVTDHDLTHGLMSIHAAYRDDDGYVYDFFRDEAEARAWLAAD